MGQLIAGPFVGKTLGEFGAEVIKIEPPINGDPLRQWRLLEGGTSLWWQVQSRNKQSLALDVRTAQGQEIARRLIGECDVLIENFRPGTMEKWGLGWDVLQAINPGLIMLRISGYGQTGPYRDFPSFGAIGEAMGGLRHLTGQPGNIPVRCGISIGDTLAALHGTIGVLMALHPARSTGAQAKLSTWPYTSRFLTRWKVCCPNTVRAEWCVHLPGAPYPESPPLTPIAARMAWCSSPATAMRFSLA
jgi:formyl-CoA transferase